MDIGAGGDNIDIDMIEPTQPSHNDSILLVPEFKYLVDFDFLRFNKFNFESDILELSKNDFEYWYDVSFKPWLKELSEKYLDIDFDNTMYNFKTQDEKRLFLTKMVDFVMFVLPYQIMKKVFNELDIDDNYDAQEYLKEESNLIGLRTLVLKNIEHNMGQLDDLIRTLRHVERVAKKNLVEENIALLDDHITENNFYLENFKAIIQESDMFKFRDLVLVMLINDSRNIL